MLGSERIWPSDACCFVLEGDCCVMRGGEMFFVADEVFLFSCADWQWQHDSSLHARFCFWFGQWGRDDCLGRGNICCDCFGAICCVGAQRVHLIDCTLVMLRHEDM
jgi:hypothetical protein